MELIDLRSDTVTKPTTAMLEAMMTAQVGDDVFGEDPNVNKLEEKAAKLFGMEAGLFCPSGTMTNQIAIKVHTQPGDEVICDELSHVYQYEGGGIAFNAGASVKLLHGNRGRLNTTQLGDAVNPDDVHKPHSRLVVLENTCNKGGGSCYELIDIEEIKLFCLKNNLKLHLDGARLFNALIAKKQTTSDYGKLFDSVSICLSKGLGAPIGSVLLGTKDFIKQARRIRKVFGGGMRQAGFIAAAGLFALDNHVERLAIDHFHAKEIEKALSKNPMVESIIPVETNILIFTVKRKTSAHEFVAKLNEHGILSFATGKQSIRFVTHLDITTNKIEKICSLLKNI